MSQQPEYPVTQLLNAVAQGDPAATEKLWSAVYDELRRMAGSRMAKELPGRTLQPTALVNEAYLRLVGDGHPIAVTTIACVAIAAIVMITTTVSVWVTHIQPYRIELAQGSREARLYSMDRGVLHRWPSNGPHISFAELVRSKDPRAIIGYSPMHMGPCQGSLCLYDFRGDRNTPVWTKRVRSADLIPRLKDRGVVGRGFGVALCWQYDIFPEHAGVEILVIYSHGQFSARVVQIYSLSGQLLYQLWYDGDLLDAYWMADAQILVFVGTNADAYWYERGYEVDANYPYVLFGVKPQLAFMASGYLSTDSGTGSQKVLWYQCLLPPQESGSAKFLGLNVPPGAFDPGRYLSFEMWLEIDARSSTSLTWVIDEFGSKVPMSLVVPDAYKKNRTQLPDPGIFKFGELPPIKKSAEQ